MKKILLSFAVACVATFAFTQQTLAQTGKPRFGMKAGLSLYTLGSAEASGITASYDARPGFQGGFYAELPVAENVIFSPQLLYTQKGGNTTVNTTINGTNFNAKLKVQVSYLDLPLLAGFKVQDDLTLFVGPQMAFLLSQTSSVVANNGVKTSSSATDGLRKTIFGGNIGAGYKFNDRVGAALHYTYDFSRVADEANDTGERNSGFALTLSYSFN